MNHLDVRVIRGRILRILQLASPFPTDEHTIWLSLQDAKYEVVQSEIPRHMDYLRNKGYVRSEKINHPDFGVVWSHHLTPEGDDLLNGFSPQPDPGISTPPTGHNG